MNENKLTHEEKLARRRLHDRQKYAMNKNNSLQRSKKHYEKNKTQIRQQRREFKNQNPDRVKNWKNSYRDSIEGKISMNLRKRVRTEIKSGKQWLELLGCSYDHLKQWFEFNFKTEGKTNFTWDNYGTVWTIDHVKPCKSFDMNDAKQVKQCFNWRNTMPVTKKYNQEKCDKIVYCDIMKLNQNIIAFEKMNRSNFELPPYMSDHITQMV